MPNSGPSGSIRDNGLQEISDQRAPQEPGRTGISRRSALGAFGAGATVVSAAGIAASSTAVPAAAQSSDSSSSQHPEQVGGKDVATDDRDPTRTYPFYGDKQAGIVTAAQDRIHFASFDVDAKLDRQGLIDLLTDWTEAAARMTQGGSAGPQGPTSGRYSAPPDDTGEAMGLYPAGLTITFGFGPTLFVKDGKDQFGIADRKPEALERMPHFVADNLDLAASDGDLCIQACSDDPQVAVHAIRNLTRIAFGRAKIRWAQLGFGRTASTTTDQSTSRNLMGFKDGTMNLRAEETEALADNVWVKAGADSQADWLAGGTYLAGRRIKMIVETWDRTSLQEQEQIIGRSKAEGAPMTGGKEFSQPDFDRKGTDGELLIMRDAHVKLVHPSSHKGRKMLRRGYNFVEGTTDRGTLNAGLFFLAFVIDPRTHFIPIQRAQSSTDQLMEYIQHTGSSLWAIPAGIKEGDYVGQSLFDK